MARVKLTEDLFAPHPSGREGTFHLIGRKGALVDERLVATARSGKPLADATTAEGVVTSATVAGTQHDATEGVQAEGYDGMKVAELRELADTLGIEHEGMKKAELVEALEDHDAEQA